MQVRAGLLSLLQAFLPVGSLTNGCDLVVICLFLFLRAIDMARRILNRKDLRAANDAAERRLGDDEEVVDEEVGDEEEDEEEKDESDIDADVEVEDEEDEEAPVAKKKKATPKVKAKAK